MRMQGFDFGAVNSPSLEEQWRRWAGRERPDLPPMWLEDLGYDKRAQRLCFHAGCIMPSACCRLDKCIGAPVIAREQSDALANHKRPRPAPEFPYAFWLGPKGAP
jgi:hypothetical protein